MRLVGLLRKHGMALGEESQRSHHEAEAESRTNAALSASCHTVAAGQQPGSVVIADSLRRIAELLKDTVPREEQCP